MNMYKCQNCPRTVERNQPMNKIIIEKRRRNYENPSRREREAPFFTQGWEIVKEIPACPQCFTAFTGKEAQVAEIRAKPVQQQQRPDNRRDKWKGNRNNRNRPDQQQQRPPKKFNKDRRPPEVQIINPLKTIR